MYTKEFNFYFYICFVEQQLRFKFFSLFSVFLDSSNVSNMLYARYDVCDARKELSSKYGAAPRKKKKNTTK